eukprot:934556-Pleurochrysis_carterae.AAC.1
MPSPPDSCPPDETSPGRHPQVRAVPVGSSGPRSLSAAAAAMVRVPIVDQSPNKLALYESKG